MSSKILHMNSTNFKIIIFISLLIIYLLVSDNIIEGFTTTVTVTTNPCPTITIPSPTLVINSEPLLSNISEIVNRKNLIENTKTKNLENVNRNIGCVQGNYVGRITK
jgi:hypothetical protein